MADVLLVKPKVGWIGETAFISNPLDRIDPNHQIYIPGNCIIGNIKERRGGYIFDVGLVFYRDSKEALQQYQRDIDAGRLEVVDSKPLSDGDLEWIVREGRVFRVDGGK